MKIDRAATDKAFGALATALGGRARSRAAFGVHDVVNENMAGAARVAIAERGRIPVGIRAAGDRRRRPRPCLACRAQARREARRLPAGRGRGQHHRHADGAGAGRSRGELHPAARRRRHEGGRRHVRRAGKGIARRAAPDRRRHREPHRQAPRRHALYRAGQRDHRHAAVAAHRSGRARRVRGGLQGAVRPHAAGRGDPVRGAPAVGHARRCPAPAASSSCTRHCFRDAREGHAAGLLPGREQDDRRPRSGTAMRWRPA